MQKKKALSVFIVDDNEITKLLLRLMAKDESYMVIGDAGNAKVAKERIRQLRPDIVFLDVVLPDSDGLDLLRWIRSTVPESVVLMVTACRDMEIYKAAMDIGACGFISKPFNPAIVLDTLEQVREKVNIGP